MATGLKTQERYRQRMDDRYEEDTAVWQVEMESPR